MQYHLTLAALVTWAFVTGPAAAQPFDTQADEAALSRVAHRKHRSACAEDVGPNRARCFARIVTDDEGNAVPSAAPSGYGPADLQSAYHLPTSGGHGKIVAVIDAYDVPNAEADLAQYRTTFGLTPCTTANGCFRKVSESGDGNLPAFDKDWVGETTLDIEMVSATCPDCAILLVEASSDSVTDLWTALATAVKLGASAATNSYGFAEVPEISSVDAFFDFPGVLVTASSGDSGYAVQYPASSSHVLAVGGTTLKASTSTRGWAESAWSSGGSGCSAYVPKPSWQKDTGCAGRMEVDVSAVADPDTGLAVYCSDCGASHEGWQIMGGTSAAAPLVAGAFTVLGLSSVDPSFAYAHTADFFDVIHGSNGTCATLSFCNAGPGYDGPTGWGTPNGALLAPAVVQGNSDVGSDAGASVVPANGASKDAGALPTPDAGRAAVADAGSAAVTDASAHATADSGPGMASDGGSPADAGASQRVATPVAEAGSGEALGDAPSPTTDGGFSCSLGSRRGQPPLTGIAWAWLLALSLLRRRAGGDTKLQ